MRGIYEAPLKAGTLFLWPQPLSGLRYAVWDEPVNEFACLRRDQGKEGSKNKEEELICSNPECTTHPKKENCNENFRQRKKKTTTAKKTTAGAAGKTKTGAGD